MEIEKEYIEAFFRLLDRGEKITLNSVAIEAGRRKGSLRCDRKGFSTICRLVKDESKKNKNIRKNQSCKEKTEKLKEEKNQIACEAIMILDQINVGQFTQKKLRIVENDI